MVLSADHKHPLAREATNSVGSGVIAHGGAKSELKPQGWKHIWLCCTADWLIGLCSAEACWVHRITAMVQREALSSTSLDMIHVKIGEKKR